MRRRLSLTARLTALFSLCSAAVLLGLGVVIALAMEQHFAVEDFTALGEHVSVIGKIVESGPAPQAEARIRDALQHRTGFVARILGPDRRALYASDGFDFRPRTRPWPARGPAATGWSGRRAASSTAPCTPPSRCATARPAASTCWWR